MKAPKDICFVKLDDARRLSYSEYGDSGGVPILSFHGGLSSRLDVAPIDDVAKRLGIRIISPDRPGIGLSTYQPKRRLIDWPNDVKSLVDHLNIERFSVIGWSCGGPYAAVCGVWFPKRVASVAMLSSNVPFELFPTHKGLSFDDRALLFLSRWAPPLASLALRLSIQFVSAQNLRAGMKRVLADVDIEAIDREGPPQYSLSFIKESMREGPRGNVRDYRIFGDPWGFELRDLLVPVYLWEGSKDRTGPPEYSQLLLDQIPNATLNVVPGEGHISLLRNHAEEILLPLADPLR